jgi:DNA-binding response OmpR family regulator
MRKKLQQSEARNINILLLDDETNILDTIKSHIERQGYNCITTCDANEAVEVIRKNDPKIDILISDYLMVGITALQVIEKIREFNKNIYIILLTGFTQNMPAMYALKNIDIDSYAEKSHDFNDLLLKIEIAVKNILKNKPLGIEGENFKFHEKIRLLRLNLSKTQDEVAEYLGVGRTTVVNYEHGRIKPTMENIKKLAELFNVSCDYLMD